MKVNVNLISFLIFKSHFFFINAGLIFSQPDDSSVTLNQFEYQNILPKNTLPLKYKIDTNNPQNILPSQDTSILNLNNILQSRVIQNEYGFRPSTTPKSYYQSPTIKDYNNYLARPSQTQILRPIIKGLDYVNRPVYYKGSLGINPDYGGIMNEYHENIAVGKKYIPRPNYDSTPNKMARPNYDSTPNKMSRPNYFPMPNYITRPNYDSTPNYVTRPKSEIKPEVNDDTGDVSLFDVVENTHKPKRTGWRILDFARANVGSALAEFIGCPLQTIITSLIRPYVSNFIYFATKGLLAREIEDDPPEIY